MTKEYKIRAFYKDTAQVIVEYANLAPMAIDLPLKENNRLPTGEELDTHIKNFLPTWHISRINKLKEGVNEEDAQSINALVDPILSLPLTNEELAAQVRQERDLLLASSDWTQLPDAALSEEQIYKWKLYRQALRDLPQQPEFPVNVIWPEK
jgi:hypothetical protein